MANGGNDRCHGPVYLGSTAERYDPRSIQLQIMQSRATFFLLPDNLRRDPGERVAKSNGRAAEKSGQGCRATISRNHARQLELLLVNRSVSSLRRRTNLPRELRARLNRKFKLKRPAARLTTRDIAFSGIE